MKVLHIIDASNHGYRGGYVRRPYYYGHEMRNGELTSVSVLHGGFTAITNYIPTMQKEFFCDPDVENYYVVCFDSRSKTIKKQEHPTYKANRTYDSELCIHAQLEYAEEVLKLYGYPVARIEGYEADDIAYSLWRTCKHEYPLIVLHSSDKDWAFMIDDDTVQFSKRKDKNTGTYEYTVIDKTNYGSVYGVAYNIMTLYKVLTGDASDNIQGVGKKYLYYIQDSMPQGLSDVHLGDTRKVRDVLLATANKHPDFPITKAMDILDLITPEFVNVDSIANDIANARTKKIPYNYITSMQPQSRSDEHRDLFYDFVEATRIER